MRSDQAALEPTCLALFAAPDHNLPVANGMRFLLSSQRSDGAWPAFSGDDEGSGLTGLPILTLLRLQGPETAILRGLGWLLRLKGRESHSMARWKFRTTDTRVRFDPAKFGWPWQPGTCSWVAPTAFALLAIKTALRTGRSRELAHRIERGIAMLIDRACPEDGWSAGNGLVYGCPMLAHIDITALALLALDREAAAEASESGLRWLECASRDCQAPWSLAWAVMALHLYGRPVFLLERRLAAISNPASIRDNATLAAVVLALDCTTRGNPFMPPE